MISVQGIAIGAGALVATGKDENHEERKHEKPTCGRPCGHRFAFRCTVARPISTSSRIAPFYPDTPVVNTADLHAQLGSVTVVDVRSHHEYETLHIKNALSVPLSDKQFEGAVAKVQSQSGRPMVFYCNGRTCKTSYEAARRALRARAGKAYVYDAGIFEWAKTYPDQTVLLGKSPIKVADLIDEARFQNHVLPPRTFRQR